MREQASSPAYLSTLQFSILFHMTICRQQGHCKRHCCPSTYLLPIADDLAGVYVVYVHACCVRCRQFAPVFSAAE